MQKNPFPFRSSTRVVKIWNQQAGKDFWFFQARERLLGPFSSTEEAQRAGEEFIKRCIRLNDSGGRDSPEKPAAPVSSVPKPASLEPPTLPSTPALAPADEGNLTLEELAQRMYGASQDTPPDNTGA